MRARFPPSRRPSQSTLAAGFRIQLIGKSRTNRYIFFSEGCKKGYNNSPAEIKTQEIKQGNTIATSHTRTLGGAARTKPLSPFWASIITTALGALPFMPPSIIIIKKNGKKKEKGKWLLLPCCRTTAWTEAEKPKWIFASKALFDRRPAWYETPARDGRISLASWWYSFPSLSRGWGTKGVPKLLPVYPGKGPSPGIVLPPTISLYENCRTVSEFLKFTISWNPPILEL